MQSLRVTRPLHLGFWLFLMAASTIEGVSIPNKFIVLNEKKTFFEAWRTCEYMNLQLASVRTAQENEQLRNMLEASEYQDNTFWIAGTDVGMEGRWIWITTNSPVVFFTNWGQINPDNSNDQDCMTVGYFGEDRTLWDDRQCEETHKVICERIKKPAADDSEDA